MLAFLQSYDVIVTPAWAHPAPLHPAPGELPNDFDGNYLVPYNLTGWPAAVVRGGSSPEGLPIGVQVVGRPWREDEVLAVAKHLETEMGGYEAPSI